MNCIKNTAATGSSRMARRSVYYALLGVVCLCGVLVFSSGQAFGDMLSLKDGRFIMDKEIEESEKGYTVTFENGKVFVPRERVDSYFDGDSDSGFVPKTDEEKAKAEKGLAPWKGKWIKAKKRAKLVEEEIEKLRNNLIQQKERRLWRNAVTVKTKRFTFKHTLPDSLFEEFKTLFEIYYATFTKQWRVKPSKKYGKATINIYQNEDYFLQVSGASKGTCGYYQLLERDLHFYFDRDRKRFTIDVMFHEGNHMLTHMINESIWYPAWLNEGLAEYYGASQWLPEEKKMKTGGVQSGRLCVLWMRIEDDGKFQGLEELIRTPRVNVEQYAWAWSFCHFLMSTEKYAKRFMKYYLALGSDKRVKRIDYAYGLRQIPVDEQIVQLKKYLKVKDLDALEKEWHDYIKTTLALDKVKVNYADAGWICYMYGETVKSRKFFKKAIEQGTDSGYVYYMHGLLQFRLGRNTKAKADAKKATELDPLHARSWLLLGECTYEKGDKKEGMRLMKLARELAPDDMQIWYEIESRKLDEQDEAAKEAAKAAGK